MKYLIILTLLLTACGSSKGTNGTGSVALQPGSSPTPTPTPNPLIGVWKGMDYTPTFQDVVTLNSDSTGVELACNWTFDWRLDPLNPNNTIDLKFTSFPGVPNAGCQDVSSWSGCVGFPAGCYLQVTYLGLNPGVSVEFEQLLGPGVNNTYNLQ